MAPALVALVVTLTGCAPAAVSTPRPSAPVALSAPELERLARETAPYRAAGTGAIAGQVTLETTRGRVIAGEGTQVVMTPATSYALAQLEQVAIERDLPPPRPPEQLVWSASTDAYGHFAFGGLPPGEYLITSPVSWRELGPATPLRTDVAYARVRLGAGESAQLEVSRKVMVELNV